MNPAMNTTIIAPTIRYVLLEPPDPLLRLLLLFAKIFLFLVRGEILAHAARFSERQAHARAPSGPCKPSAQRFQSSREGKRRVWSEARWSPTWSTWRVVWEMPYSLVRNSSSSRLRAWQSSCLPTRTWAERAGKPEVMVLDNAFGGCHSPADFLSVQAAGRRFEQNVGRVSEELPGATQDQEPDGDADQGVCVAPAGEDDGGGGNHRADRSKGVGDHVAHGPLHVQALAPGAVEDGGADRVDEEPECGDDQHRCAEDLCRLSEARVGLDEDPDRDRHQRHTVSKGRQDLGPTVAEALLRRRRSPGQPGGE